MLCVLTGSLQFWFLVFKSMLLTLLQLLDIFADGMLVEDWRKLLILLLAKFIAA